MCNRYIKFGALWEEAVKLGAESLATGHYARIEKDESGKFLLKKAADKNKDQSYFLYRLAQEQLGRAVFPVGDLTKREVRKIAAELGLPAVSRPESHEICFIPDNDHAAFLESYIREPSLPGPVLDGSGRTLGWHRGIASYTIGQRKGLGIAAPEPLYVTAIDSARNAVIAGAKEETYGTELIAAGLNWISIAPPRRPISVRAKIRYRHAEAGAVVMPREDDTVSVRFNEPQMAITPGQAVVFYDGDTVVGGGTIMKRGI
jgi:tRNA-specific 2-thiouridylase